MSRRRKSSPFEDVISLLALLPWWVSLLLAVISYFVLHVLATSKPQVVTQTSPFGTAVAHSVYVGFAILAQYLIPILCVAAAGVSFFKAKHRTELVKDVASSKAADVLDHMSWQDFERLVGKAFELDGTESPKLGAAEQTVALTSFCGGATRSSLCSASSGRPTRWALKWSAISTESWPLEAQRVALW